MNSRIILQVFKAGPRVQACRTDYTMDCRQPLHVKNEEHYAFSNRDRS
jgi:hypothetical protein